MLTISMEGEKTGCVVAVDVVPTQYHVNSTQTQLPKGSSIYVCDRVGTVIFKETSFQGDEQQLQDYISQLLVQIQKEEMEDYKGYVMDLQGIQCGVYYYTLPNGWSAILTVPFDTILNKLNQFSTLFSGFMLFSILVVVGVAARDMYMYRQIRRTNETVHVLGNVYYALYRINYEKGTYETIKASQDIGEKLPAQGKYQDLLDQISGVSDHDTFQAFYESFSADGIRTLVEKQVREYGGDFKRRFGAEYRWVNIRMLYDGAFSSNEVVLCFSEVEEEKQHQMRERAFMQEALERARRSESTKQAFFNHMSHDMRTPLNAILGLSDLAQQHIQEPEQVLDYIQKIQYSSRQLLDLVNDILDMSRIEQGKVILNQQTFDICQCIEECVATFRLQAEMEKKRFHVEYDIQSSCVLGDSFRIAQILNNLLSNAFKFTEEGDEVYVGVRQFEEKTCSQFQFIVRDTGIGMSEEFLPQLFEPYARETQFSSRQITGTGLGMPIVKNLVTQMSGQIHVQSKLQEGTTFTITVPFTVVGAQNQEEKTKQKEKKQFSLNGYRILLAEDNMINMEIATEILTMHGIQVIQAWNGKEAVELFRQSKPFEFDAILLDMLMPQMGGCEAAKYIREMDRPDAKQVPMIAVTANAFSEDIAATTAAGMDAHISKPIDFNILCATMQDLLQQREK